MTKSSSTQVFETLAGELKLTQPAPRLYGVGEGYQFLVHVPLGSVGKRFEEIGSEKDGVLMASIINGDRQGTFQGEGGIIIRPTSAEAVLAVSEADCGGEIAAGAVSTIEEVAKAAANSEYNQIDLSFGSSEVVGVAVKVSAEGIELGDPIRNRELRKLAEEQDLPVVVLEVRPDTLPSETRVAYRVFSENSSLSTYDIPCGSDVFLRVDIARGNFYHSDSDIVSRSMVIDRYGQASHKLSEEYTERIRSEMSNLSLEGKIDSKELEAVNHGITTS